MGGPSKQRGALFYIHDAPLKIRTLKHKYSKPKPHQGHTITWRSSLRILASLEREKQQHNWHMVRTKATPWHAEVRLLKCVVYIMRNPVTFVIHRCHNLFLLDEQARERKHQAEYKRHVHRLPAAPAITITTKEATHNRCNQTSAIYRQRGQLS